VAYGPSAAGIDVDACERSRGDVVIGNDVWIGYNTTILSGVTIGDGAVIGACSVITRDVPPYGVCVGNPGQVVRKRFDDRRIELLLDLSWWNWPDAKVAELSDLLLSDNIDQLLEGTEGSVPSVYRRTETTQAFHQQGMTKMNGEFVASEAAMLYLGLLIKCISNTIYGDSNKGSWGSTTYDAEARRQGTDWPEVAHSMIGVLRLENLCELTRNVIRDRIPGDLIETGVWRGGACILMRGVLQAYGDKTRKVYVADSFQGLPPPNPDAYPADAGQIIHTFDFLAVTKLDFTQFHAASRHMITRKISS
jgi:hypothetical protein